MSSLNKQAHRPDSAVSRTIQRMSAWLNWLSCLALAALMLLVTVNIVLRVVFKAPILGTYDMSGFLTVFLIGGGLAFCSLNDGHIEIGYFLAKLGQNAQRMIVVAGRLLSFLTLSTGTYAFFAMAFRQMKAGEVSVTTRTPLYWFTALTGLCFALLALTVLVKLIDGLRKEPVRDT